MVSMTDDIGSIFSRLIDEVYNRNPPIIDWQNSIYERIKDLSIDQRGQAGEDLVEHILKINNCEVVYNPNRTDREKDWDIISNDIHIEVKLATLGKDGKMFQHENLERSRRFDALMIIDVAPNDLYLTCFDYDELNWKQFHRRTSGIYKYDISLKWLVENDCLVKTSTQFFDKYKIMEEKTLARLHKKKDEKQL